MKKLLFPLMLVSVSLWGQTYQVHTTNAETDSALVRATRYLAATAATSSFLTAVDSTTKFLSIGDAAATYLTSVDSATKFLSIGDAAGLYLTSVDSATKFLSIGDAASTYITAVDSATKFLSVGDAVGTYLKISSATLDSSTASHLMYKDASSVIRDLTLSGATYSGATMTVTPQAFTAITGKTFTYTWSVLDTVKGAETFPGWKVPYAITITEISAYTDADTTKFNIEQRGETTPNSAGTDCMTVDLVADNNQQEQTSFADATVPINTWLVPTVSATGDVAILSITIRYTID